MSFHRTFNEWLIAYTGATVIAAYQGQDRPALPYLMTNVTDRLPIYQNPRDITWSEDADDGDQSLLTAVQDIEWRVSVHAYGPDPLELLAPIMAAKHLVEATWPLLPYRLHEVGRASFVPEIVENQWEPRAVLRVICHGIQRETRPGEVIETQGALTAAQP